MLPNNYYLYFVIMTGLLLINGAAHGAIKTESLSIKGGLGKFMSMLIKFNKVVTWVLGLAWVFYLIDLLVSRLETPWNMVNIAIELWSWFVRSIISPYIWSSNRVQFLELYSAFVLWVLFAMYNRVNFGTWSPRYYEWNGYKKVSRAPSRTLGISFNQGLWPIHWVELPPLELRARRRAGSRPVAMFLPLEWKKKSATKEKSEFSFSDSLSKAVDEGGPYVLVIFVCALLVIGVVLAVNWYERLWDELLAIPALEDEN
jgi:hypothetical protein